MNNIRGFAPWVMALWVLFFPYLLIVLSVPSEMIDETVFNSRLGWLILISSISYLVFFNKAIYLLILIILSIFGSVDLLYAYTFESIMTVDALQSAIFTSKDETVGFLQTYMTWQSLVLLFVYFLGVFFLYYFLFSKGFILPFKRVHVALSFFMMMALVQQSIAQENLAKVFPGTLGVSLWFYDGYSDIEETLSKRKLFLEQQQYEVESTDKGLTLVLVIGESASKNHMSLYGYKRKTTPLLEDMNDDLIIFQDVISSFSQTHTSLRVALTEASTQNNQDARNALSIIDVANAAGFKTFWFSNQESFSPLLYTLASFSHESRFINTADRKRLDENILPLLEKSVKDNAHKKLIVLHLIGSHFPYEPRYPESQAFFDSDDSIGVQAYAENLSSHELEWINQYDNSIRYKDYLLGEMIEILKLSDQSTVFIYTSDHGEEVFDSGPFKGHRPDNVTSNMVEIPFIMWANPLFKNEYSGLLAEAKNQKNAPVVLDDLYHTILDLSGIKSPRVNIERSFIRKEYVPVKRMVYGRDYDKELK